jgi:hypothetical protein
MKVTQKLAYGITAVLAWLLATYLPAITYQAGLGLDAETQQMIIDNAPQILLIGVLWIGGHTLTDVASMWLGYQPKSPREALRDVVDEIIPSSETIK